MRPWTGKVQETSERLVLVNHDAVGHLREASEVMESSAEISSGEGYHNRSPDVCTTSCNHVVALFSIKCNEEVDFPSSRRKLLFRDREL